MAKPAPPSLTDYAVMAISPALIMAMVGSLVFFLVEVLYAGKYSDRLLWTLFFFVIGTVLIARILILHGASRALIYAAGLAAATFLALQAFVDYPNLTMKSFSLLINAGLMAIIWWMANKLTWDCTHIDEDRKNAGRGVLDAAMDAEEDAEPEEEKKKKRPDPEGLAGWVARYMRHRKKQNEKPHTPGVWVLYFSLASLPIFGLGQSLIPPGDAERRGFVFRMMAIFVASGLGLLMTTTLLGLRKYLRDRGASIPGKMTAGWLGLGAAIIAVFLVLGALLPRPHSETPLVKLPKFAASKDRDASKNAQVKDGSTGKGQGAGGNKTENDPNADQTKDGKQGPPNRDDKDGQAGGKSDRNDNSGEQAKGEKQTGEKKEKVEDKQDGEEKPGEKREPAGDEPGSKMEPPKFGAVLEKAASVLKWIAWVILALLVLVAIVILILRFLAPFTGWAKGLLDWLSGLFKKKESRERIVSDEPERPVEKPRPPPFDSFENPLGQRMPVEEMVTYSFSAFESWAYERGHPRRDDETPFEFARRIERATGFDGQPLVKLYGQVVYASQELPNTAANVVREFWKIEGRNRLG